MPAPARLPTLAVGDFPTEEHIRVFEAYRRDHAMPWAGQIPTAAMYNVTVDWWNGLRPDAPH